MKFSNKDALESILEEETQLADKANLEREEARNKFIL